MFIQKYFAPEDDLAGGGGGSGGGGADASASAAAPDVSGEAPTEPVSMEDTIRNAFKEISGRERDERGRFAKAQQPAGDDTGQAIEQTLDPSEAAPDPAAAAQPNTNPDNLEFVDNAGQTHAANIAEPPTSWRAEAKAAYAALPENVRREIHKREHDFHNGVQQYKSAANFALQIGGEFKPYEPLLRSQNWTPQALTRDFMNSHYRLSTGDPASKAAEIVRVAGLYNVSPQDIQNALANASSQPSQTQTPPEVLELRQRLDRFEQEREQTEAASIQEQIRQFESDGKHEFFKQVAVEMGALLKAGRAKDMQDAYDKAIWSVPEVRAKLQARQAEEQRRTAAEKAAAAKKAASVNVPARGKHPSAAPVGSMEDTIRAEYRRLNGGG